MSELYDLVIAGVGPAGLTAAIYAARAELKVILINLGQSDFIINSGDRIAQIIVSPVTVADFTVTDSLSDTQRGEKGFGSTGV